jgi:hypothetical protein
MKVKIILLLIILSIIAAVLIFLNFRTRGNIKESSVNIPAPSGQLSNESQNQLSQPDISGSADNNPNNSSGFFPPMMRAGERVAKKPFGIFITPQSSPVQPEHFRGYHTGADFEIFPEELNVDVAVNGQRIWRRGGGKL